MAFSDYRIALVTGASSGIGLAVTETLARNGLEVHALARNAERLHEVAGRTGCIPHALDVTDTAALPDSCSTSTSTSSSTTPG